MNKLLTFLVAAVMIGAAWSGMMWCIWSLWKWVLPQVYAAGPPALLSPGFWLFAACWTLMVLIGRGIFGSKTK